MKSEKELLNELTWQLDFLIRKLFPESEAEYDNMLCSIPEIYEDRPVNSQEEDRT